MPFNRPNNLINNALMCTPPGYRGPGMHMRIPNGLPTHHAIRGVRGHISLLNMSSTEIEDEMEKLQFQIDLLRSEYRRKRHSSRNPISIRSAERDFAEALQVLTDQWLRMGRHLEMVQGQMLPRRGVGRYPHNPYLGGGRRGPVRHPLSEYSPHDALGLDDEDDVPLYGPIRHEDDYYRGANLGSRGGYRSPYPGDGYSEFGPVVY